MIQQSTERRLQSALQESHAESSRALVSLVDARALGTKRDIEEGVVRALETAGSATLAKVQEAAMSSLQDFATKTHSKLDEGVPEAWSKARGEAAEDLQHKLTEFLTTAEQHINTMPSKLGEGGGSTALAVSGPAPDMLVALRTNSTRRCKERSKSLLRTKSMLLSATQSRT